MLSRMFRASCFIYILSVFSPFVFCFSPFSLQAGESKSASGSALAVRIAPVRLVEEGTVIRVPGTVEAVEHSTISARISAVIVAVPIKLGDRVGKGQVLVRLQADELNARASQARAQLEQVRRNLARETRLLSQQAATAESVRSLRDAERIAAASLREAEAMLAYTVITAPYDRVGKGQVLVRLQADELNARASQARAQLEQVRRNLARETRLLSQQAATAESVRSLRDAERIAAASLQEAEAMLAYTVITAPYDGVVSKKMVNVGDLAAPGMALLELENTAVLQVRAQAPEEIAGALALETTVPVLLPASGQRLETRLVEIAPAANPAARSVTIILAMAGADSTSLRSGQYLQVLLPGTGGSQRLVVPRAAVSSSGQMERVFVLEADRARLRLVRTGALIGKDGEEIEITGGLDAGELLILNPPAQLSHDQAVQVRP